MANARVVETAPEERPDPGPGIAESLEAARAKLAEGRSLTEEPPVEELSDDEVAVEGIREEEGEAGEETAGEEEEGAEAAAGEEDEGTEEGGDDDDEDVIWLPDGWEATASGKVKRSDGTWASQEDLDAIEAGEPIPWQVAQDGGKGEPEFTVVRLPGRNAGEESEWEIADPALVEEITRLKKGYLRGEQLHVREAQLGERETGVAQREQEQEDFLTYLQVDPVGVIMEQVTKPEIRRELLANLVAELDEDGWRDFAADFDAVGYDDPEFRARRAELKAKRLESKARVDQQLADSRADREQFVVFRNLLMGLGQQVPERQQGAFVDVAAQRVADYIEKHGIQRFRDPERDILDVLVRTGTLHEFGIDPERAAAQQPAPPSEGAGGGRSEAEAGGSAQPAAPAVSRGSAARRERSPVQARRPAPTGDDFRRAREARMEAGVSHGGSGAAPTGILEPPKGQTVQERIAWFRKQRGTR